jgi:hypothetical protein
MIKIEVDTIKRKTHFAHHNQTEFTQRPGSLWYDLWREDGYLLDRRVKNL